MITQTVSLLEAMYATLGPGLLLVAALPALLVMLGMIIGTSLKRFGRRSGATEAT